MIEQSVRPTALADVGTGETNRFPDAVQFYLRWHRIEGHTPATARAYEKNLGYFVRWLQSNGVSLDLTDLAPVHILAYLSESRKDGRRRSPRYTRSIYTHINTFLNWCVDWGLLEENPADKVKPPKVPRLRKAFLKPEHAQLLMDLCPPNTFLGSRRRSMMLVLATTGIRRMELHGLQLDDLDWDAQLVRIRLGKGQKDRIVPLHRDAQRSLLRYLQFRTDSRPELWLTEERRPLTYWGVGQDLVKLMKRAGIRDDVKDVCHVFRRTWAANAVKQGIPRPYIQAIGGWDTPDMIDKYTAAMLEEESEALEAFRDFDALGGSR